MVTRFDKIPRTIISYWDLLYELVRRAIVWNGFRVFQNRAIVFQRSYEFDGQDEKDEFMEYLLNKRVLVTGGASFLGSHLWEKLLNLGCEVLCVDNLFTGTKQRPAKSWWV